MPDILQKSSVTPLDILVKTREILADEKAWVKEMWAHDPSVSRVHVMPGDKDFPDMPCFCLHGAIYAAARRAGLHHHAAPSDQASRIVSNIVAENHDDLFEIDPEDFDSYEAVIHDFNDHYSIKHADVLSVLDKAIANAKESPA